MKWLAIVFGVGVLAIVGLALAMRLVSSDPARWHSLPEGLSPGDGMAYAVRMTEGGPERFAALDRIARGHARTQPLAGGVDDGLVTYVTRSAFFGFPDYTTMSLRDGQIVLYARSRFGKSDLGVNAARLDGWLSQL